MEIYITVKGQIGQEKIAGFKAMFDLMVASKTGAPLETYVEKTFPEAEAPLEALLDAFEDSGDTLNLEIYKVKKSSWELSFMGSYALEDALPDLKAWLSACGMTNIEVEGSWV